jgi:hypothetical protein
MVKQTSLCINTSKKDVEVNKAIAEGKTASVPSNEVVNKMSESFDKRDGPKEAWFYGR